MSFKNNDIKFESTNSFNNNNPSNSICQYFSLSSSSSSSSSSLSSRNNIISMFSLLFMIFNIFVIGVVVICIFLIFSLLGLFYKEEFRNRSDVIIFSTLLPQGKNLYDLNTFTFRNNGSLYRYRWNYVILDDGNKNDFQQVELMMGRNNMYNYDDEVASSVMTVTRNYNNEFSVNCEGVCDCYVENNGNERRINNLVYSFRYTGAVVVSILGFATARFIDKHIDDCYENARRVMGDNYDNNIDLESPSSSSSSSALLVCSMDNSKCDTETGMKKKDIERKGVRIFECNGHCLRKKVTKRNFNQKEAQKAMRKLRCHNKWAGKQIIELTEEELIVGTRRYNSDERSASVKYVKSFLGPFCKSLKTQYCYLTPRTENYVWVDVKPCCATTMKVEGKNWRPNMNVRCKKRSWIRKKPEPEQGGST